MATRKAGSADPDIMAHVKETMDAANAVLTKEEPQRPDNEPSKFINLRMKETDYNRLKGLYGSKGLSMSAGMRMTALYMADMVEAGAFSLSAGGYIDKRRG
jgi:hypothetical protein